MRISESPFDNLRFQKVVSHFTEKFKLEAPESIPDALDHQVSRPLRGLDDVCGYRAVFMPGDSPCYIIKSATNLPQVINLRGKTVFSLSSFNVPACERGFVYVDVEVRTICPVTLR